LRVLLSYGMPRASAGTGLPGINMTALNVSMRSLLFILAWLLLFGSAFADEGGMSAAPATEFRLKGVLISPFSRSALVNNKIVREGDRVAGAEILSISEGEVQILTGSQELTVSVGSTAAHTRSSGTQYVPLARSTARYGPVMSGETLSEIAERHLVGDITRHQMMIALFEANPQAFGNNINVLREGTMLRIPASDTLYGRAPATATAEVVRQVDAWRSGPEQPVQLVEAIDPLSYGPVTRGETLSGIAAHLSRDGATVNQMMTALFHANPQAFSGNINVLYEGAVLRIPDPDALHRQTPEMAAAEVLRHADTWRPDVGRSLQSAAAGDPVNLPGHDPGPPSGDTLLSMNSSE